MLILTTKDNAFRIAEHSGIVGVDNPDLGGYIVYYEGNLYGACNIVTWADKVFHAADRAITKYPTTARSFVPYSIFEKHFEVVGNYDESNLRFNGAVKIHEGKMDPVKAHCGSTEIGV